MNRHFLARLIIFVHLLFFTGSIVNLEAKENAIQAKHVFVIGFDGLGAYAFKSGKLNMPMLDTVIREGSSFFDALGVLPSYSVPNWMSAWMGAGPEVHEYRDNHIYPEELTFPSIFSILREQRPDCKMAFFYEWEPWTDFYHKVFDKNQIIYYNFDKEVREKIVPYIETEKPNFTLISFDEPDAVGHDMGHDTPEYYEKLNSDMDNAFGLILEAIKNAGIWDDSVIIVLGDHGGIDFGHGGDTIQEREIPVIIMGKNIRSGYTMPGPVNIYDIAPTIAHIFNLITPPVWTGKVLSVFID